MQRYKTYGYIAINSHFLSYSIAVILRTVLTLFSSFSNKLLWYSIKQRKQERSYLQQIINRLKQIISHTDVSVKDHVDTLAEYKDYLWNNKDIDPHEIRSMRESILNHFAIGESVIDKRRRLAKIVDIPYFGRIDFQEKSENCTVIPVYVLMRMIR